MYYDNSYENQGRYGGSWQNDQRGYSGDRQNNPGEYSGSWQNGQKSNKTGKNAPPIRMEVTEQEFSALNSVYARVIHDGVEEDQVKAQKLQEKIMKYTRDITDDAGRNKKRICFFENEAAATIGFLIRSINMEG